MDLSSDMNRAITISCFIIGLMSGCLPDPLPVGEIPSLDSRIVVSSQVVSDQSVLILLTRSFGALDANGSSDPVDLLDQIAINDATVIIDGSGFRDTLEWIDAGVYGSVSIPFEAEGFYTLYVKSPTMGEVQATTRVKPAVPFNSLTATLNDNGFDTLARITYSLQDIPGKNNYMVTVQHISADEEPDPQDFLNPNIFIRLKEDDEFSDGELLGETFNAVFRRDFFPGDTLLIQLANIERDYYDFLELRKDTRFNFSDFLGEPVNYPSNVEGGLGWFNLHFPDVRVIRVVE